ncbi:MAG: PhoPQ-activated protein PqaA family protein [Pirellulaceae bacterium]
MKRAKFKLRGAAIALDFPTLARIDWRHVLTLVKPNNFDTFARRRTASDQWWRLAQGMAGQRTCDRSQCGEPQMMATVANQFGCYRHTFASSLSANDGWQARRRADSGFVLEIHGDPRFDLATVVADGQVGCAWHGRNDGSRQERWGVSLKQFTVTGASKRGWTTWLTGATDQRATAIAPMVIDMLNMSRSDEASGRIFRRLLKQIDDYTDLNLPAALSTPVGQKLQSIVDPFSYREKLTMPNY